MSTICLYSQIVARLRDGFRSHVTLDYEYRMKQLRNLKKLLNENEANIMKALDTDLNKVAWLCLLGSLEQVFYQ